MMTKYEHHCYRGPSCEGWMGKDEEGRYVLAKDHETKVAELRAENAKLEATVKAKNESIETLYAKLSKEIVKAEAANVSLARLHAAVPEDDLDFNEAYPDRDFDDLEIAVRTALYPKESDNG